MTPTTRAHPIALLFATLTGCAPLALTAPPSPTGLLAVDWHGAILPDGHAVRCEIGGRDVSVAWDVTIPARAQATLDPPLIRLRPDLQALRPGVQLFALLHECGHLTLGTLDERSADCWAAARAELPPDGWLELRDYLVAEPGGAAQWAALQPCRGDR